MKLLIFITVYIAFIWAACAQGQSEKAQHDPAPNPIKFEFTFNTAHPNAQILMKEDFFWSPIEETGPFGSDDGSEAAYDFQGWRKTNKDQSPITFLKNLIKSWQYPYFDWNILDTEQIKDYQSSQAILDETTVYQRMQQLKEISKQSVDTSMPNMDDAQLRQIVLLTTQSMGSTYILGQDNAIIGIGFAQLALEGKVDSELKAITIIAIKRQLLSSGISWSVSWLPSGLYKLGEPGG